MITKSEWKDIAEIVKKIDIPGVYKKCIIFGINKIYNQMKYKPIFIGLCGSAAREDIISNFSDIDLLFIHSGENLYNIRDRYVYHGIKVGLTILPNDFSSYQYQDRKPWYFFRCFNKGIYKRLYGDITLIPQVNFDKLYNVSSGSVNLNSLKQAVVNDIQEEVFPKALKHCHTIMKNIILLEHKKELEGYRNIYKYFYKNFKDKFITIPTIDDLLKENIHKQNIQQTLLSFVNDFECYLKDKSFIL